MVVLYVLSFTEGLAALGMLDLLRAHPNLMRPLFLKNLKILTADVMENMFKITLSDPGSNQHNTEIRIVGYWRDFLQDCECKYIC